MRGVWRGVVVFVAVAVTSAGLAGVDVAVVSAVAAVRVDGNGPLGVGGSTPVPEAPSGDWSNRPPSPGDASAVPTPRAGSGFDARRSVEDVAQKTAQREVFTNPDGSQTVRLSAAPVRFKGSDGGWHDYDLRLQPGTDVVAGKATQVAASQSGRLPVKAGDQVATGSDNAAVLNGDPAEGMARLDSPAGLVTLGVPDVAGPLAGVAASKPDASTMLFQGKGVAVQMRLVTSGVEQSLVVDSAAGPSSYATPLTVPDGVTARESDKGEVELVDVAGTVVAVFRGGMAFDRRRNGLRKLRLSFGWRARPAMWCR